MSECEALPNVATSPVVDMEAATALWQGKTYILSEDRPFVRPARDGGLEDRARDSDEWAPCEEVGTS